MMGLPATKLDQRNLFAKGGSPSATQSREEDASSSAAVGDWPRLGVDIKSTEHSRQAGGRVLFPTARLAHSRAGELMRTACPLGLLPRAAQDSYPQSRHNRHQKPHKLHLQPSEGESREAGSGHPGTQFFKRRCCFPPFLPPAPGWPSRADIHPPAGTAAEWQSVCAPAACRVGRQQDRLPKNRTDIQAGPQHFNHNHSMRVHLAARALQVAVATACSFRSSQHFALPMGRTRVGRCESDGGGPSSTQDGRPWSLALRRCSRQETSSQISVRDLPVRLSPHAERCSRSPANQRPERKCWSSRLRH
ncbi:hypothetical protein B0T14DRAFT_298353 [Immersiella caudata]|uniref:Uncharacterized protein n=1 Tax=Immersiella caudata TaxID=314043 RepID=A0AA40BUI8_9PEZI|nr:hypothetical protein B0T14DRAFT_298353 [Immersiella caudata]